MKKFRLPRKIKKKLKGDIFFRPSDKDGYHLVAHPERNQEDYDAYKQGVLERPFHFTKAEQKARSEEWDRKFKTPCELSDEELVEAVNNIFAEEYREDALRTLRKAKEHPIAIEDYYVFCNAYKNESCETTACLSIDGAKDSLKRSEPRKKK